MPLLEIQEVVRRFGDFVAVDRVSIDIRAGEFFTLLGPSGCGKTTLLRMVAGFCELDRGRILLGEARIDTLPPHKRNTGMVFQNYAVFPNLTVGDNVAYGLRARKVGKEEIRERVARALKLVQLPDHGERWPHQLSGGQLQRVAIGRAVVRSARLYLFDEPLSNLDAQLRDEMRGEIKRLHQELGKTMIYVTHDQIEAMTMADRIVLLRDGAIEQAGAPLELFERPATKYVAGFLGSPSMNFLNGRLVGAGDGLAVSLAGGVLLPVPPARSAKLAGLRDQTITLGLRPEHMNRAHPGDLRNGLARHVANIELLQPTGSRTYATFKLGGTDVVAELQAHDVTQINQNVDLSVDMNRAVLIDPDTGKVI